MTILPAIAERDTYCWQCRALGIPAPTILAGDSFRLIDSGSVQAACCEDCFERLREECEP